MLCFMRVNLIMLRVLSVVLRSNVMGMFSCFMVRVKMVGVVVFVISCVVVIFLVIVL